MIDPKKEDTSSLISGEYFTKVENLVKDSDDINLYSFRGITNTAYLKNEIQSLDPVAFSWAIKLIKLWAKSRGIYGYNYGYLNGVSLIIMMIKATKIQIENRRQGNDLDKQHWCSSMDCSQSYLEQRATQIVYDFFKTYAFWNFENEVICLNENADIGDLYYTEKTNKVDMFVFTPEEPYKCTTANIMGGSSIKKIKAEIERGFNYFKTWLNHKTLRKTVMEDYKRIDKAADDRLKQVGLRREESVQEPVNPEAIDYQFLNSFKEIDWKEFFAPQSFFAEHKFFL